MDNFYDEIDPIEIDTIEEELPSEEYVEPVSIEDEDEEDAEFSDIIRELRFQLNFGELCRKYIKIKIRNKTYKVVPITEFKKSGTFVLKTDKGEIIQAKKTEIVK